MTKMRQFRKGDLLAKSYAEYPEAEHPYMCRDWEEIEGFLDAQDIGRGRGGSTESLVRFVSDGEIWGFIDWWHEEVGCGLEADFNDDSMIECWPVKEVITTKLILDKD